MTKTAARERPILFSAPMVRAILDGRKTQTRRVINPPPPTSAFLGPEYYTPVVLRRGEEVPGKEQVFGIYDPDGEWGIKCPYEIGTTLWVRETFSHGDAWYADADWKNTFVAGRGWTHVDYQATSTPQQQQEMRDVGECWSPSIHMPRWASRITLEITNVRAERVQDIASSPHVATRSEIDAIKEEGFPSGRWDEFAETWDALNAKRGYGWDANPWVWVLRFKGVR